MEAFEAEVGEQSIVKTVIDRELKTKQTVADDEVRKYYDANTKEFTEPARWKVRPIFFPLLDPVSKLKVSDAIQQAKIASMKQIATRVRKGEDFAKLAKEFTEDKVSRELGGEYTFVAGQESPEFEAAAAALKPGQVSEVVVSRGGVHLIQLLETFPGKTKAFEDLKSQIKEQLLVEKSQKALPAFIEMTKKDRAVVVLDPVVKQVP